MWHIYAKCDYFISGEDDRKNLGIFVLKLHIFYNLKVIYLIYV